MIPMNFLPEDGIAAQLVTGTWSKKALAEGRNVTAYRGGSVQVANPGEQVPDAFVNTQLGGEIASGAAYYHFASNETIHGVQFGHEGAPWRGGRAADLRHELGLFVAALGREPI